MNRTSSYRTSTLLSCLNSHDGLWNAGWRTAGHLIGYLSDDMDSFKDLTQFPLYPQRSNTWACIHKLISRLRYKDCRAQQVNTSLKIRFSPESLTEKPRFWSRQRLTEGRRRWDNRQKQRAVLENRFLVLSVIMKRFELLPPEREWCLKPSPETTRPHNIASLGNSVRYNLP